MTIIALTQSVLLGVVALVAYVVYVQIENYVVTPRIMKITAAATGTANNPPTRPNKDEPMRAAIIVTAPGTDIVFFIMRGVTT